MTPEETYKLRRDLIALLGRLEEIRNAIQEHSETIRSTEEAKRNEEATGKPKHAVVTFDDQTVRDNRRESDRQYGVQNSIRWAAWLAFSAAALYAGLAYFQWREMIGATGAAQDAVHEARLNRAGAQKSLNATIEQFRLDQRAWVGITNVDRPDFGVGKIFKTTVIIMNTGKTPAKKMQSAFTFDPIPKGKAPDFRTLWQRAAKGQGVASEVLQPNGIATLNIKSNLTSEPLTQGSVNAISGGSTVLYVYGEIRYDDVFRIPHWTKWCFVYDPLEKTYNVCPFYNDVDDNK